MASHCRYLAGMRGFFISASAAITIAAMQSAPASAQENGVYLPDGQWRLSALDDGCSVTRDFLGENGKVTLSIKRVHPRSAVQFAIIGLPTLEGSTSLSAGFTPGEKLERFDRVAAASIGERSGVVFAGLLMPRTSDGERRARPDEVTDFVVTGPRGVTTTLHTRAIDKAVVALDACVTKKLQEFGLDLDYHTTFSRHAEPKDMEKWAHKVQRNYPKEALRNLWTGAVPLRLIADADGRVTHCHVTDFLTAEVLRDAACTSMIKHARYYPALDAEGQPATDFAFQVIRYTVNVTPFSADAHGFKIHHD